MKIRNRHAEWSLLGLVMSGLLVACGGSAPARPAALDPSNPDAPEAPRMLSASREAPQSSALPPKPIAGTAGEVRGASSPEPASATVYVCPMHPEVTSDQPIRCPKCGMKLVPKGEK